MISATTACISSNGNLSGITCQLLNIPTKFNNVNSLTRASREQKEKIMPDGYIPSDSDICCGRGKQNWNKTGNLRFRKLIRASVAQYTAAPSKKEKSVVILSVVHKIQQQGGHFLKQRQRQQQQQNGWSNCCWYDIGGAAARDKVRHSLRDQFTNSAPKSPLLQAKQEQTIRCAADASTCDCASVESATASCASWWI
jgi:hypothetical protein